MAAGEELPMEIIINILVRSPVNSLLRFRCVCKSWRSLISDPYFIRKHTNHFNVENGCQTTICLLPASSIDDGQNIVKSMNFIQKEGKNNKLEPSFKDLILPALFRGSSVLIRCCCDGLLCLLDASCGRLMLWNPYLRKHKTLPLPPRLNGDQHWAVVYGIGYDQSIDDYKIFRVHSGVDVIAMKSKSWRTIKGTVPYVISDNNIHATFTNGRIHWMAKLASTEEILIAYIDVVGEAFGKLPLPHTNKEDENVSIDFLQLFKGNLCVAQSNGKLYYKEFHLWELKEYGIKESWTKLLTIPDSLGRLLSRFDFITLFSMSRNGILLFNQHVRKEIVWCRPIDETFKVFFSYHVRGDKIPYAESLVSPNRR